MARIAGTSVRGKLLQSAAVLFYRDGIAATGIDAIIAHAGVAKQSLYNNFASKADLVSAYVRARHDEWLGLYAQREAAAHTPRAKVLAVFEAYEDHAELAHDCGFRGCGLLNAASELVAGDPGRLAVRDHKAEVEAILAAHLAKMAPGDGAGVARLARHLSFLLEGAITRAGLEGDSAAVAEAKAMAARVVDAP
jgi:AcrR family transcriptional regulator